MAPRLRVLAGSSPETLVPITSLVNTSKPHTISSDLFEGQIVTHIKGFTDERGVVRDSEYFGREDRKGVTWSIQVQGVPHKVIDFYHLKHVFLQGDFWSIIRRTTSSLEIPLIDL